MAKTKELLDWLDEEQRRSKAELGELKKHLEAQEALLESLRERTGDLEGRFTRLEGQVAKLPRPEEVLSKVREELTKAANEAREERRRFEEDEGLLRQKERENYAKALESLKERISAQMAGVEGSQEAELQRLNEGLLALRQETETFRHSFPAQGQRLDYLEEWGEKLAQELHLFKDKVHEDTEGVGRGLRLLESEWQKESERLKHEVAGYKRSLAEGKELVERLGPPIKEAEKVLSEVRKIEKRLQERRGEFGHIEELVEGRLKKMLADLRKENEKKWAKNARELAKYRQREDKIEERLAALWQAQVEYIQTQMAEAQRWVEGLETKGKGEVKS